MYTGLCSGLFEWSTHTKACLRLLWTPWTVSQESFHVCGTVSELSPTRQAVSVPWGLSQWCFSTTEVSVSCLIPSYYLWLWCLSGKESTCQCRRCGFDPWVRRSPGEGNGNLLQYSCLENPVNRGTWQATVHGVTRVGHNIAITTTIGVKSLISEVGEIWV